VILHGYVRLRNQPRGTRVPLSFRPTPADYPAPERKSIPFTVPFSDGTPAVRRLAGRGRKLTIARPNPACRATVSNPAVT